MVREAARGGAQLTWDTEQTRPPLGRRGARNIPARCCLRGAWEPRHDPAAYLCQAPLTSLTQRERNRVINEDEGVQEETRADAKCLWLTPPHSESGEGPAGPTGPLASGAAGASCVPAKPVVSPRGGATRPPLLQSRAGRSPARLPSPWAAASSEGDMVEDEMFGWHHRLNGHEFEQALGVGDGRGGLACCSPWGHKESDTTERLN